jgi:hypothetical protein
MRHELAGTDIWGTVRKMRELYGAFAAAIAVQRAKKALKAGDFARSGRWTKIALAIGGSSMSIIGQGTENLQARLLVKIPARS